MAIACFGLLLYNIYNNVESFNLKRFSAVYEKSV